MNSKLYFLIFIFNFGLILSLDEQSTLLEKDKEIEVFMTSDTMFIFSQNTKSGVYNYDIEMPYPLEATFAKSDSPFKIPELNQFEGHFETIKREKDYIVSIDVSVNNDDKYTFLKLYYKDYKENALIKIKLTCEYSLNISLILIGIFAFGIIFIFLICFFGKNFLAKCCNYQ